MQIISELIILAAIATGFYNLFKLTNPKISNEHTPSTDPDELFSKMSNEHLDQTGNELNKLPHSKDAKPKKDSKDF